MASKDRASSYTLSFLKVLQEKPFSFGFFQAVRLMECLFKHKPRVGKSLRPIDDPVRFTQPPSMKFATSTLQSLDNSQKGKPPKFSSNFFGVFGPNGAMPLHLTEYAYDRVHNSSDPTFAAFADIFHHRMVSLFYRSWANAQPVTSYDRPDTDKFSFYVGSLFGGGFESMHNRDAVQDRAKLYYSGLLANQSRNAEGLISIIKDYFQMPAALEQFIGDWLELPEEGRCQLGITPDTATLGLTAAIGSKVWDCQQKFRIVLGPLDYDEYQNMLPGSDSLQRLTDMVRNYVGDEIGWDIKLILKKDQIPFLRLGKMGNLGWTSNLKKEKPVEDMNSFVLNPFSHSVRSRVRNKNLLNAVE